MKKIALLIAMIASSSMMYANQYYPAYPDSNEPGSYRHSHQGTYYSNDGGYYPSQGYYNDGGYSDPQYGNQGYYNQGQGYYSSQPSGYSNQGYYSSQPGYSNQGYYSTQPSGYSNQGYSTSQPSGYQGSYTTQPQGYGQSSYSTQPQSHYIQSTTPTQTTQPSSTQTMQQDKAKTGYNYHYTADQNWSNDSSMNSGSNDQSKNSSWGNQTSDSAWGTQNDSNQNSKYPQDYAATASDQQINNKIRDKLSGTWYSKGYEGIIVKTNNGMVTLEGKVDKADDIQKITAAIQKIDGVQNVNNRLVAKNG